MCLVHCAGVEPALAVLETAGFTGSNSAKRSLAAEILQQVFRRALAVWVCATVVLATGLFKPSFDLAVVDDGSISPAAATKSQIALPYQHAQCRSELSVAVGDDLDVVDVLCPCPSVHDERIIDAHAVDGIDTKALELCEVVLEPRKLVSAACGSESTRQAEQDHPLVAKVILGGHVFPSIRVGSPDGVITDAGLESHHGNSRSHCGRAVLYVLG